MTQTQIAEIIRAVQQGDTAQFATIYDTYAKDIYRFVYIKISHKEIAEDLLSDIFIKVIDQIHRFNPNTASFRTWLYRIARNTVIDYYRTHKTTVDIDGEDTQPVPGSDNLEEATHARLLLADVQKQMKLLTQDQQDVLLLRVWYGMSYEEIAQVLKKNATACRMMYSRGVSVLKEHIILLLCLSFIDLPL